MNIVKKSVSRSVVSYAGVVLGAVALWSAAGCAVAPVGSDEGSAASSSNGTPAASSSHRAIAAGTVSHEDAKLFDWNSCYSATGSGLGSLAPNGCLEQWGSYPAECESTFLNVAHAPGQRCKNVCQTGTCGYGCFSNYDEGDSLNDSASFYKCQDYPPQFIVYLASPEMTVTAGGYSADVDIDTMAIGGSDAETIDLAITGLPSGVTAYLGAGGGAPTSVTTGGHMDFTLKVDKSVAAGNYLFQATGTGEVAGFSSFTGFLTVQ